jgi:hypothetical protein
MRQGLLLKKAFFNLNEIKTEKNIVPISKLGRNKIKEYSSST